MNESSLDMTNGVYRKVFSGFLTSKRLNAVSMYAEATFWRLQAIADDWGNLYGDTKIICGYAFPRREVIQHLDGWIQELLDARLIARYEAEGDSYIHILRFQSYQPANKNGRRIQRHPREPENIQGNLGESGGIQELPKKTETIQENPSPPIPIPIPIPIPRSTPSPSPNPTPIPSAGESERPQGQSQSTRTGPCPRGWNLDTELAKITAAFPASNSAAAPGAAKNAVRRLGSGWGDTPHPNEWTAAEWLYGRVVAWANSPLCISTPQRYRPGMKKWMDEEMYLADPAQWQGTHESDKSKPEDEDMDAKLARIAARVAESRAKEAKWAAEDAAKAEAAKLNGAKK